MGLAVSWSGLNADVLLDGALRRQGGAFYQYAFSAGELCAALRCQGFGPLSARSYDSGWVLRATLRALRGGRRRLVAPAGGVARATRVEAGLPGRLRALARRVLCSEPTLRALDHMLLVVARRP